MYGVSILFFVYMYVVLLLDPRWYWTINVIKVYYHEDFHECTRDNDIAIFEHSENIPNFMATPICLPPKNFTIGKKAETAGAGLTGHFNVTSSDVKYHGFFDRFTDVREYVGWICIKTGSHPFEQIWHTINHLATICTSRGNDNLENVYFHEDFDECSGHNDIAIFEHSEDIPSFIATPICLPPKNIKISTLLKAAGAGLMGHYKTTMEDAGEPDREYAYDFFTDVREYVDWICEKTGICPPERKGHKKPKLDKTKQKSAIFK
ncbi:hypothetical protein OSTOST_05177, partial [Ostertagia ostertagi]